MMFRILGIFLLCISLNVFAAQRGPFTQSKQASVTPEMALQKLEQGNKRFMKGGAYLRGRKDAKFAKYTSKHGQHPFAVILNCVDSRSDPTLVFDQHIGDVFIARVAGNIANTDNIASMEFAVLVAGAKLVVVMGHTHCGAVAATCKGGDVPGNIHKLAEQIAPAVEQVKERHHDHLNCSDPKTIDEIAKQNVIDQIDNIYKQSPDLAKAAKQGKIMIVGAMHDISTGKVTFFNRNGKNI